MNQVLEQECYFVQEIFFFEVFVDVSGRFSYFWYVYPLRQTKNSYRLHRTQYISERCIPTKFTWRTFIHRIMFVHIAIINLVYKVYFVVSTEECILWWPAGYCCLYILYIYMHLMIIHYIDLKSNLKLLFKCPSALIQCNFNNRIFVCNFHRVKSNLFVFNPFFNWFDELSDAFT